MPITGKLQTAAFSKSSTSSFCLLNPYLHVCILYKPMMKMVKFKGEGCTL